MNDRCPNLVYFNITLLILHLSAFKTLICKTEIEAKRVYFLGFCKTMIHDFQNSVLNS